MRGRAASIDRSSVQEERDGRAREAGGYLTANALDAALVRGRNAWMSLVQVTW
jgi:hypothetical protein